MIFDSIQKELNSCVIDLSDELIKSIRLQEVAINHIKDHAKSSTFKFSDKQCLADDVLRLPPMMGVYLIFRGDSLVYIGYGNIASRVSSFKKVLLSDKDNSHRGAVKARADDVNPLNYQVSCVTIPDASLAAKLEESLINDYSPLYCEQSMGGK